jgi:DNA-binding SARP family transcriptional activator
MAPDSIRAGASDTNDRARSVSLVLFGTIDLRANGAAVDQILVNDKAIALLALLAVPSLGRYVRRDAVVGLLWPELDQSRARTALRKTIHVLRRALGADVVHSRGDEDVSLSRELVWCDASVFVDAADDGLLLKALQLYRGELMPGFHLTECWEFSRWLEEQRASMRERAAGAAWAMAQRFETDQQLSDAAGMARWSVRYSWSDERALRRALSMLDRIGDRAGALKLYDEFARRLKAELEAQPSRETIELAARLRG